MAITRRDIPENIFTSGRLEIPAEVIQPWLHKLVNASVISALLPESNLPFGEAYWISFTDGEAQLVREGDAKKGSKVKSNKGYTHQATFQKTIRFSEKVLFLDREKQIGFLSQILSQMHLALARALDFAIIYGIDPKSGEFDDVLEKTSLINTCHNVVTLRDGQPGFQAIDEAERLVLAHGYVPNGIALDPSFAAGFATQRSALTEQRLYPTFNLGQVSELEGLRSAVSNTVSGSSIRQWLHEPPVRAIVGDWNTIAWSVSRTLRTELFDTGNPDNVFENLGGEIGVQGRDLAGHNEVAVRVEIDYSWGVQDPDALALVEGSDAAAAGRTDGAGVQITAQTVDVRTQVVNELASLLHAAAVPQTAPDAEIEAQQAEFDAKDATDAPKEAEPTGAPVEPRRSPFEPKAATGKK